MTTTGLQQGFMKGVTTVGLGVTFPTPYDNDTYNLFINCYPDNGNEGDKQAYTISNRTVGGFTITPTADNVSVGWAAVGLMTVSGTPNISTTVPNFLTYGQLDSQCLSIAQMSESDLKPKVRQQIIMDKVFALYMKAAELPYYRQTDTFTAFSNSEDALRSRIVLSNPMVNKILSVYCWKSGKRLVFDLMDDTHVFNKAHLNPFLDGRAVAYYAENHVDVYIGPKSGAGVPVFVDYVRKPALYTDTGIVDLPPELMSDLIGMIVETYMSTKPHA